LADNKEKRAEEDARSKPTSLARPPRGRLAGAAKVGRASICG
jgi:hypothetical protein